MILNAQPRWYVVETHPHAEVKAAAHLTRQGFEVYLPRFLRRRRHARRIETVPSALFPRYLFVAIDMTVQPWRCIASTLGVRRLVCGGNEPAVVPQGLVEELKSRQNAQGYVRLDLQSRLEPGDRVRMADGVFANYVGVFERITDNERVAVLLDLLGRKVRVVLDGGCVSAA